MIAGTVLYTFVIVAAAITLDAVLGAVKAIVTKDETFDLRKLPGFLASGIFPYVGSLAVLAVAAEYAGEPFTAAFYAAAATVTAKYVLEIKDKMAALFGADITARG